MTARVTASPAGPSHESDRPASNGRTASPAERSHADESAIAARGHLRRFVRDVFRCAPRRAVLSLILLSGASVLEGTALALLFPMLSLIGVSGQSEVGEIAQSIVDVLSVYSIPINIYTVSALFVSATVLQYAFYIAYNWFSANVQADLVVYWRKRLTDSFLNAQWLYLARSNAGSLTHVTSVETERASELISYGAQTLTLGLTVVIYFAAAWIASWQATLMLLGCGIFIVALTHIVAHNPHRLMTAHAAAYRRFSRSMSEMLLGIKLIRAVDGSDAVRRSIWPVIGSLRDLGRFIYLQPALIRTSFEVAAAAALMATLTVSVTVFGTSGITVLLIAALFLRLYPRVATMQQCIHICRLRLPCYSQVVRVLEEAESHREQDRGGNAASFPPGPASLEFRDVDIGYGGEPVLRDVSFAVLARQIVGFAGQSGAGKSTLIDTLLRLVPNEAGDVLVNGRSLSEMDVAAWRRAVGYVPQDTILFSASIRDNIAFAQPDATPAEVQGAAQKARLDEFIRSLPHGYDTMLGEGGVGLSGGQKQRIGIARALLGRKALLILDEATASLDAETEAAIMADIEALRDEMTILLVSHRLSTLRAADRIYVLGDGTIAESGSWRELTAGNGIFRSLWDMQAGPQLVGKDAAAPVRSRA